MTEPHAEALPALDAKTAPLYLSPWLDGELDARQSALMADFVAADPALAALSDRMRTLNTDLAGGFGGVLEQPLPLALVKTLKEIPVAPDRPAPAPKAAPPWRAIAAVLALAVAGGVPAGWLFGKHQGTELARLENSATAGWLPQIAAYHRIYSSEKRHLVEVEASEAAHIRTWLSDRLGRPFAIPDLMERGYRFRGARMLVINGERVAQLMYVPTSGTGGPLGLCFLKSGKADQDKTVTRDDDLTLVSWRKAGYAYVVVGAPDAEALRALADAAEAGLAI